MSNGRIVAQLRGSSQPEDSGLSPYPALADTRRRRGQASALLVKGAACLGKGFAVGYQRMKDVATLPAEMVATMDADVLAGLPSSSDLDVLKPIHKRKYRVSPE